MNEPRRLVDEPPNALIGELLRAGSEDPMPSQSSRMRSLVALGLATSAATAATTAASTAAASTVAASTAGATKAAASIAPAAAVAKVGGAATVAVAATTAKVGGGLTAFKVITALTLASAGAWTAREVSTPTPVDVQVQVAPKVAVPVHEAQSKLEVEAQAPTPKLTVADDAAEVVMDSEEAPVDARPTPAPLARPELRRHRARTSNSAVAQEIAAIDGARKAMDTDPKAALEALEKYDAANPAGRFAAESAFLRIQALRGQGRDADAARAAESFKQRFPTSPLNARLK